MGDMMYVFLLLYFVCSLLATMEATPSEYLLFIFDFAQCWADFEPLMGQHQPNIGPTLNYQRCMFNFDQSSQPWTDLMCIYRIDDCVGLLRMLRSIIVFHFTTFKTQVG